MLRLLLLPLLAVSALAQSSSTQTTTATSSAAGVVLSGTRSVTSSEGIPTSATYLDYGTSIIYLSHGSGSSVATLTGTTSGSQNSTTTTQAAAQSSALAGTRVMSSANSTGTQSAATPVNTVPCNGYPEFCNRQFSNITMIAAHNSPFDVANNVASNQDFGVLAQLNDGIRLVQGQTHFVNGVPHLCHTSCDLLDVGPLSWWLANITEWLDANPYEVVAVIVENGDYAPIANFTATFESTGINNIAYIPSQIPMNLTSWPTLGEMIISGKRAVVFMDYDANQTEVPYVLDEFSQLWETPFDPTDATFPCTAQRPPNLARSDAENRMYMINHNLNSDVNLLGLSILVPNISNIAITNGIDGFSSAGLSANQCISNWTRPPNFINVDYYNRGSPYNGSIFEVAAQHNNVTYDHSDCCGKSQGLTNAALMLGPNAGLLSIAIAVAIGFLSM